MITVLLSSISGKKFQLRYLQTPLPNPLNSLIFTCFIRWVCYEIVIFISKLMMYYGRLWSVYFLLESMWPRNGNKRQGSPLLRVYKSHYSSCFSLLKFISFLLFLFQFISFITRLNKLHYGSLMKYFVDVWNRFYVGLKRNRGIVLNLVRLTLCDTEKMGSQELAPCVLLLSHRSDICIRCSMKSFSSEAEELYAVAY